MARLNVSPTKANSLQLRRDLGLAREGFEMLDQKRQILVLELIGSVESARRAQAKVQERMAAAYKALRRALLREGTLQLTAESSAPQAAHSAEISTRSLMGIHLSSVSGAHPAREPAVSLLTGSPALDETAAAFHAAAESIDKLAEIENTVFRLAREVRKTQRRVNALEKIFIPSYEDAIRYIAGVLEERERDDFIVMRMIKERLGSTRAHDGTAAG